MTPLVAPQSIRLSPQARPAHALRTMLVRGLFAASALLFGAFGSATAHAQDVDPDGDGKGGACSAFVEKNPLPGFAGVQAQFGPTQTGIAFGSSYLMINTSVPEPIPIRLSCSDTDTLYKKCLRDCIKHDVGGYWTAEWSTLDIGFGGARGSFIDPNGNLTPTVSDAQHAVYLPPRDIACGTYRSVGIRARIFDPGPDAAFLDSPVDVYFQVDVWRPSSPSPSYYWVMITPYLPTPSDAKPPECPEPPDTCCKYIGGTTLPDAGISAGVSWQPSGMLVNDIRTIVLKAGDMDRVVYECGVPPKCPSTFANEPFGDGLTYTWTVLNGPATILRGGRTALIQAGATAGKVDLQVVIDDCTGFCADDPPVTLNITLYVYELDFIDSGNAKLPRLSPVTTQNEGLRISQVVTNTNMNGAGGLGAPNFAGPVPAPVDPRTYRTEIARGGAPAAWPFTVRIRTSHAWAAAEYEGGPEFDNTFATVPPGGGVLRSDLHMRLVSNKAPVPGAAPAGVYDDAVCGNQTILALPGDWVTATLIANGTPVGSIELPVERPWNETGLPAAGPQSILQGRTAWFANVGTAGGGKGPFYARRMTEDFAQTAVRGINASDTAGIGPFTNAFFMQTIGVGAPATGTLTFDLTNAAGVTANDIPVAVTAGQSFATVAGNIVAAINTHAGFVSTSYYHPVIFDPADRPYYFLINRQTNVAFSDFQPGTTGISLQCGLNYADALLTVEEMIVLGLNIKPDLTASQSLMDTIVVTALDLVFAPNPGVTASTGTNTVPEADLPGLSHTVFVTNVAGDGNDASLGQTTSHEYCHFLQDGGGHQAALHYLMATSNLFPGNDPPEDPSARRRLTPAESTASRANAAAFLTMPCVTIPNRK